MLELILKDSLQSGTIHVKNSECTIYITTRRGWKQAYRKVDDHWTQTGPNGVVRPLSAEQLLSHILPLLAADNQGPVRVTVERDIVKKPKVKVAVRSKKVKR